MKKNYKNISHYKTYFEENRGTNKKEWLIHNNKIYLFKETQIKSDNTSTNAHFSESIYSDIAAVLNIKCVNPQIVIRNKKIGIITEYFLNENEELIDFNSLIQNIRLDYEIKNLKCKKTKEYYSIHLLSEALKSIISDKEIYREIKKQLLEEIILDSLCDHYDRNASNIGIIKNYNLKEHKRYRLAPIYDNGTSLYASLPIDVCKNYINNLKDLDNNIISKISIGNRYSTYDELLDYIIEKYYLYVYDIIDRINNIITEDTLNIILNQNKYDDFDKYHKNLIYNKLLFNVDKINKHYNKYSNINKEKQLIKR